MVSKTEEENTGNSLKRRMPLRILRVVKNNKNNRHLKGI